MLTVAGVIGVKLGIMVRCEGDCEGGVYGWVHFVMNSSMFRVSVSKECVRVYMLNGLNGLNIIERSY